MRKDKLKTLEKKSKPKRPKLCIVFGTGDMRGEEFEKYKEEVRKRHVGQLVYFL